MRENLNWLKGRKKCANSKTNIAKCIKMKSRSCCHKVLLFAPSMLSKNFAIIVTTAIFPYDFLVFFYFIVETKEY